MYILLIDNDIKGAKQGDNSHYVIQFTCKKCDGRNEKIFTKKAYHHGIVVIKCDKCCSFHLIADNLGWFGDKKNIERWWQLNQSKLSYDDLGGTISPSLNPDALLSHNIFYVREGVPFVRNQMGGGNYTEEENQIIVLK